jgi:excisionase family DNA binding protein
MTKPDLSEAAPRSSTVAEIARRHSVGETTVRRQIRAGLLEAIKIGRCTRVPIDAELRWLSAGRTDCAHNISSRS